RIDSRQDRPRPKRTANHRRRLRHVRASGSRFRAGPTWMPIRFLEYPAAMNGVAITIQVAQFVYVYVHFMDAVLQSLQFVPNHTKHKQNKPKGRGFLQNCKQWTQHGYVVHSPPSAGVSALTAPANCCVLWATTTGTPERLNRVLCRFSQPCVMD